jgi:hypothetical protein
MYVVNCYDGIFRRLQTSVEQSDYRGLRSWLTVGLSEWKSATLIAIF